MRKGGERGGEEGRSLRRSEEEKMRKARKGGREKRDRNLWV